MKILNEIKSNASLLIVIALTIILWKVSDNYIEIYHGIEKFIGLIMPFIYAFIIAYILSPIVSFFDKIYGEKRILSIASVYAILIAIFIIIINYLIPKLGNNIYEFSKSLPGIYDDLKRFLLNIIQDERLKPIEEFIGISSYSISEMFSESIIDKITNSIQYISAYIFKITLSLTYQIVKWGIGFLIAIYILLYKENFKAFFKVTILRLFGRKRTHNFFDFLNTVDDMIGRYIGVKAVDSIIIGSIALLGFIMIKSPFAFLFALIVAITNMIPYFGPFVGMVITSSIHLFYSSKLAISSLVFLFLLQQFDAWFLDPKLVGNKVGLNPFLIILAITIGGGYFGPIGMILSVPTMALIRVYFLKFIKLQTQKNIEKRKQKYEK
ncbi:MAG: AI-2E family transporter [Andreesenia angusta]|nr:AI-2E family transporter [Andreesenia angusta]